MNVLFVCTANICRSPMAEAIFNALESDAGASHRATSAGVSALVGDPMAPNTIEVLEEVGVYPPKHRARQADAALIEASDLVLAMTPRHVAALRNLSEASAEKIHTLPDFAYGTTESSGIADPYGLSISAYRSSAREIFECVDRIIRKL